MCNHNDSSSPSSSPNSNSNSNSNRSLWKVKWNISLAIRYHMLMQGYYERLGTFVTVIGLLLSSSAGVSMVYDYPFFAKILTLIVVLLQAIELAVNTKSKAFTHQTLRIRYLRLSEELDGKRFLTSDERKDFKSKIISIEIDEPIIKDYVLKKSHQDVAMSFGIKGGEDKTKQKLYIRIFLFLFF